MISLTKRIFIFLTIFTLLLQLFGYVIAYNLNPYKPESLQIFGVNLPIPSVGAPAFFFLYKFINALIFAGASLFLIYSGKILANYLNLGTVIPIPPIDYNLITRIVVMVVFITFLTTPWETASILFSLPVIGPAIALAYTMGYFFMVLGIILQFVY